MAGGRSSVRQGESSTLTTKVLTEDFIMTATRRTGYLTQDITSTETLKLLRASDNLYNMTMLWQLTHSKTAIYFYAKHTYRQYNSAGVTEDPPTTTTTRAPCPPAAVEGL
ncbi:hypothetical protein FQR65_LT12744 [Abscondita terminalis]|nr:hypothetical protein FQR65_LT12744 [Abscondita terminalis]